VTVQLEMVVSRRGVDPAAATCESALRELLRAPVAGVERGELWRFELLAPGADPGALRAELQGAACRAGRYVNLNRDECRWLDGPRPYPPDAPRHGCAVDVWVRDGDGRDAVALAWFRKQVDAAIHDLWRGVVWRLWLPTPDPDAARETALELAVARGRRHGLLANPHSQSAEVLHVVTGPVAGEAKA
jgi:hypothetical protein